MNPLYQQYGQGSLIQKFLQFKKTFTGNPQQTIQMLLNSGKMSQSQYNQLLQQAKDIQQLLHL